MKKILSLLLVLSLTMMAQAQTFKGKVYLNQAKKTTVFNGPYLNEIGVAHYKTTSASMQGRSDTLRFSIADGQTFDYLLREVDSVTFYAPDSLMRSQMAAADKNPSTYYPTYSDDYRSISGWDKRSSWQLANVHDPTVMKAADGYYYMSQTDAGFGNPIDGKGHFYVRRSKDMINWEPVTSYNNSCILPNRVPTWVLDSVNAVRSRRGVAPIPEDGLGGIGYWAPVLRKINDNLYRCYYCIVLDGNFIKTGGTTFDNSWPEPAWIGLAETTDPASGKWVDKGGVLCSPSDKGKDDYARNNEKDFNAYARFNAIDPTYVITPEGKHWLIYGSWHSGIAAIEINPETGKTLNPVGDPWNIGTGQTTRYGKLIATRNKSSRWQGSEGPEVIYNPETGYYYLFLAYDGLDIPYNTRVVRAKNVDGPYYGKDGVNVTTAGGEAFPVLTHPYQFNSSLEHDGWVGISHCAVWDDGQGNWFFSSQGRKPENYSVNPSWVPNAIMMGHVRRIYWTNDGWPIVSPERYAGVVDAPISPDDLVGSWELIDLTYSYGNQKTSSAVTIKRSSVGENRVTVSGAISGSGSFNAATNMLALNISGTNVNFNVARELDWEASPRKSTIVMATFRMANKTYWLKRVGD